MSNESKTQTTIDFDSQMIILNLPFVKNFKFEVKIKKQEWPLCSCNCCKGSESTVLKSFED